MLDESAWDCLVQLPKTERTMEGIREAAKRWLYFPLR